MTPSLRKFALTAHVSLSVALLGSVAVFLALALTAVSSNQASIVRAAYLAMDLAARLVIVPLAFASLSTGVLQSLGTHWGLFRHYWVVAKLLITVFAIAILLAKLPLIGNAAVLAAASSSPATDLRAAGIELATHAIAGLLVLLVPTALSIYKPRGLTPYGRRHKRLIPSSASAAVLEGRAYDRASEKEGGVAAISFTLRRAHLFGVLLVVLILHIVILHVSGGGIGNH